MIVPMKKVSLVVIDREREASLNKLREAGVVHLEKKNVSSDSLAKLLNRRTELAKAQGLLRRYSVKNAGETPADPGALAGRTLDLGAEKKILLEQLVQANKEYRRMEPWGDFDPDAFILFEKHGLKLVPYELPLKVYESLADDAKVLTLSCGKRLVRLLAVEKELDTKGFFPFAFPEYSLSRIEENIAGIKKRLADIEHEFAVLARGRGSIEAELKRLKEELEFETASAGMETIDASDTISGAPAVSWLSGYVPAESLGVLKRAAAENGWALVCAEPAPEDRPPTLVKNNAFVRIIQPLFSLLGTVPGYREYDISASYLVFFCLFFAMIFGDAAYGLLLFAAGLTAGALIKKKSGTFPDAVKLILLLSCCTIAWGSVTGSWFAAPVENLPVFLRSLVIPPFNNTGPLAAFPRVLQNFFNLPPEVPVDSLKTRWNIEFLCFTVGVIQLVYGRSKNIKKFLPSLTALAQAGWLVMMIGLYFLVLYMILKAPLPPFAVYLIFSGLGLYFIFAEQNGGNFFVNIGKSFSNFLSIFLNAVGSFADIISYIRLFAVGLAGSIIAQSFNEMSGIGNAGGPLLFFVLKTSAAVLVLLFGHSLNIVMNALSVIVHGVRLNLLEYAGNHLGMEWSGYAYSPFAVKKKKTRT